MPASTDPQEPEHRPARSRLEAEIDEILERAEREHPTPPPPPPVDLDAVRRQRAKPEFDVSGAVRSAGVHARRWLRAAPMLVAFAFAILANTVDGVSPFMARLLVSAAVIAFFWPVLEGFRDGHASATDSARMWRGRDMGPPPSPPQRSPIDGIRQWLRDRRILP
jgi:hypothetical protein